MPTRLVTVIPPRAERAHLRRLERAVMRQRLRYLDAVRALREASWSAIRR